MDVNPRKKVFYDKRTSTTTKELHGLWNSGIQCRIQKGTNNNSSNNNNIILFYSTDKVNSVIFTLVLISFYLCVCSKSLNLIRVYHFIIFDININYIFSFRCIFHFFPELSIFYLLK